MSDSWSIRSLKDCAQWLSGGTPRKSRPEFWGGDIPWISAKSLNDFFVSHSESMVTEFAIGNGTRLVPANSILFVVRGMSLKSEFRLGITTRAVSFNQDVKALIPAEGIDPNFLVYAIKAKTSEILSMVEEAGHGTGVLPTPLIQSLEIAVPSISEQLIVAGLFRALDDKIELNRQMNTTLESMAQALFKSWFVDFDPVIDNALAAGNPIPEPLQARAEVRQGLGDKRKPLPEAIQQQFPDQFVFTEEMGWVPEGWDIASLDTVIELIGGGTPKTSIDEYWGGDIPWFSVVDAPRESDVFCINTDKSVTKKGIENSSTKVLRAGTTIISARGTVGKCALVGVPMAMNQSCYGIVGQAGYSDYYIYYTVLLSVADLQRRGHGSVFNTITRDTFSSIRIPRCSVKLSHEFHDLIAGMLNKICSNLKANVALEDARNILLPKLLSGELRIPDAQKLVAEAL